MFFQKTFPLSPVTLKEIAFTLKHISVPDPLLPLGALANGLFLSAFKHA